MFVGLNLNFSVGRLRYTSTDGSDNTVAIAVGVTVPIVIVAGAVIALVALLLFALRLKRGNSSYPVSKTVEAMELLEGDLAVY